MESRRRDDKPRCRAAVALAGVLIMLAAGASGAADGPQYIPLAQLQVSDLPLGRGIVTEGMFAGRVDDILALRGSSIFFVMQNGVADKLHFADFSDQTALRVTGTIEYNKDTKTWYVSTTGVVETESARQKVLRALNDSQVTAEKLLEIGRWARQTAIDFRDARLETLAQAAFIKALKLTDLSLKDDDYEGYFALAQQATQLLQKTDLREFYVREGISAFIVAKGEDDPNSYYEAAKKAGQLLPGGALSARLLQEGFGIEVGIGREAETTDYYALAAKAKQVLGEGADYHHFLELGLAAERQKIPTGDYDALYALARKAREIYAGFPAYRSLVWEAIAMEKSSMDVHDGQAWLRLGNRIIYFLDDTYQAGLCFKEAIHADPTMVEPREKLRELGYVYYNGQWWKSDELAKSEMFQRAQELEDLTAAGKVSVGMSREQILRAKGKPQSANIAGGGWGVTSQWIYTDKDNTLYVDFIADTVVSKGEVPQ